MKGKQADKQIARIRPVFAKWIEALKLDTWCFIDILYYAKRAEFFKDVPTASDDTLMHIYADWRYMSANIHVCVPKFKPLTDAQVEFAVVHELMHIYVNEMTAGGKDHEERVVTQLMRAMMYARAAAKDGRL